MLLGVDFLLYYHFSQPTSSSIIINGEVEVVVEEMGGGVMAGRIISCGGEQWRGRKNREDVL